LAHAGNAARSTNQVLLYVSHRLCAVLRHRFRVRRRKRTKNIMSGNLLVINVDIREIRVALIESGVIAELHIERLSSKSTLGNICLGTVSRVLPGMQAAFIDIGEERAAFLHVEDLIRPDDFEAYLSGSSRESAQEADEATADAEETEAAASEAAADEATEAKPKRRRRRRRRRPKAEDAADAAADATPLETPDDGVADGASIDDDEILIHPASTPAPVLTIDEEESSQDDDDEADDGVDLSVEPGASDASELSDELSEVPAAPASDAPSSDAPASDAPSSIAPASDAPSSIAPASDAPSSEAPASDAPSSDAPASDAPSSAAPASDAPSSMAPASDAPSSAAPASDAPSSMAPASDAPQDSPAPPEVVEVTESGSAAAEAAAEADAAPDELGGGEPPDGSDDDAAAAAPRRRRRRARIGRSGRTTTATKSSDSRGMADEGGNRRSGRRSTAAEDGGKDGEGDKRRRGRRSTAAADSPSRGGRRAGRGRSRSRTTKTETARISKSTPIREVVREGQQVVVQVTKQPIGSKGARVSSHISLPGRYVVYLPTVEHVGISKRIGSDSERSRLRSAIDSVKPPKGGLVVRTVAEGLTKKHLKNDVGYLVRLWSQISDACEQATKAPSLLYEELDLVLKTARDLFTEDVGRIVIDNREQYGRLCRFVEMFMPERVQDVELYEGREPVFDAYGIEDEIGRALSRKVPLKSGGHLIIDQAEALTAIDVNTGRYVGKGSKDLEDTILQTNLEAVAEIAYQLRFRNIGGLIILDLIDMDRRRNREKVRRRLESLLANDKAKTTLNRISDLGLMEMTRKRTRESLGRLLHEPCFYCDGTGQLMSRETIAYEILRQIRREQSHLTGWSITVNAHPAIIDLLKSEEKEAVAEVERMFKRRVVLEPCKEYHIEQFDLQGG